MLCGKAWRRVCGPRWFGQQTVPTTCSILACWRSLRGRGMRPTGKRSSTRRRLTELVNATGLSSLPPSVIESCDDLTNSESTIVFRHQASCKLLTVSVTAPRSTILVSRTFDHSAFLRVPTHLCCITNIRDHIF